ncbi:sensor histidine kinase [Spirillospora sp. CA-294931]|uniref:sensor histidine kinase n=1 Tax=Spirillospora sp. CA-294931 TaxID=3240042 RepID=UPI003D937E7A
MEGPAGRELRTLLRSYAAETRLIVAFVCGVLALSGGTSQNIAITAGIIAVCFVWSGVYFFEASEERETGRVGADLLVICGVCLLQGWLVPPDLQNAGTGWVRTLASVTIVTYQWHTRPSVGAWSTLAIVTSYTIGLDVSGATTIEAFWPRVPWMLVEALLSRMLFVCITRGGRRADMAIADSERHERERVLAAARRADERDYLADLHDTAAATLLMVGTGAAGSRAPWLARQAHRDLDVLSGQAGVTAGDADLREMLGVLARRGPLTVSLWAEGALRIPSAPALAICRSVQEALVNVARHAGVDSAAILARSHGDAVSVEVVDRGRGFDPDALGPQRRGVARSIVERMARTGGRATVTSQRGQGTRVRVEWSPGARREHGARSSGLTAFNLLRALRIAMLLVTMTTLLAWGPLMHRGDTGLYRSPGLQIVLYSVVAAVTALSGIWVLRGRPLRGWRWPLLAVVFAATALGTADVRPEHLGSSAHWEFGQATWFGVLVLMELRLGLVVAVLVADFAWSLGVLAVAGQAGAASIGLLVNAGVIMWACQLAFVTSARALRRLADVAAENSALDERARTETAVAEQLHHDRQARYAELARTAVPLLRSLASGLFDPADPKVRRACMLEAARMRRLLAENEDVPDPLLHELGACVDLAARRGVDVTFVRRGGRAPVETVEVRRALVEPVMTVLASAVGTARVTLVAGKAAVTVSVIAELPPGERAPERAGHEAITISTTIEGRRTWVETSVRTPA